MVNCLAGSRQEEVNAATNAMADKYLTNNAIREPKVSDSDTRRNSGLPQDTPGSADKTSPSERIVDKRRLTMVPAALLACDFTQEQQDKQYEQQQQQQHEEQGQPGFSLSTLKQVFDGEDWKEKVGALKELDDALKEGTQGRVQPGELVPFMESLAEVVRVLRDNKPEVQGAPKLAQMAARVIGGLAQAMKGGGFCLSAAAIIPELLPFLSTPRETVQESVTSSIETMLAECHSPAVLRVATVSLANSKKAHLRRKASTFLCVAIERWPQATLRTTLPPIMGQMRKALFDADATVRREGRQTFGAFIRNWPAEGGGMYHALDRANQRAVLQEQPHVSNFIIGKGEAVTFAKDGSTGGASSSAVEMPGILGGGGGQRPAGVTVSRAQQRILLRWKIEQEKEKERERLRQMLAIQQRRVALPFASLSAPNTPTKGVAPSSAASGDNDDIAGGVEADSSVGEILGGMSGIQAPRAGSVEGGMLRSPLGRAPGSLGLRTCSMSPSNGLRKTASQALLKHNLLSPTMKKLLREVDRIPVCAVVGSLTRNNVSEREGEEGGNILQQGVENRLHTASEGKRGVLDNDRDSVISAFHGSPLPSPGSQESRASGERASGGTMAITPTELRQYTAGDENEYKYRVVSEPVVGEAPAIPSPLVASRESPAGGADTSFHVSSCSSSSSSSSRGGGDSGSSPDCDESTGRAFEEDERDAYNLAPTTRALFKGEGSGKVNVQGQEEERTTGEGINTKEPPPPRPSSCIPKLSSLSSSSLLDGSAAPAPSAALSQLPDDGKGGFSTRAPATNTSGSAMSGKKGKSELTIETEHSELTTAGIYRTPTRRGVLTRSGGSTHGEDTAATWRVRFRGNIDTSAISAAGSLNSPCNSDSKKNPVSRRWWSLTNSDPTSESDEASAVRSPPLWRSILVNALLVASTLGAFSCLSSAVLLNGFDDSSAAGAGTSPTASVPSLSQASLGRLPPRFDKLLTTSVLDWFVDDQNPAPDLCDVADSRVSQGRTILGGDVGNEGGEEAARPALPVPQEEIGDMSTEQPKPEADASAGVIKEQRKTEASMARCAYHGEAQGIGSNGDQAAVSKGEHESADSTGTDGGADEGVEEACEATAAGRNDAEPSPGRANPGTITTYATVTAGTDTEHPGNVSPTVKTAATTTPLGSYHSRKGPPQRAFRMTEDASVKVDGNFAAGVKVDDNGITVAAADKTGLADSSHPAAAPAATSPLGSYHRRKEPPQYARPIDKERLAKVDGDDITSAARGNTTGHTDSSSPTATLPRSTTPLEFHQRRTELPHNARPAGKENSVGDGADGTTIPVGGAAAGHADSAVSAATSTTTSTPLGSYHRGKEQPQHARHMSKEYPAEVNGNDAAGHTQSSPPAATPATTTTPFGSYHRKKPPQHPRRAAEQTSLDQRGVTVKHSGRSPTHSSDITGTAISKPFDSSVAQLPAASGWGWVEVWAAMAGAVVIFLGYFCASIGNRDVDTADHMTGDLGPRSNTGNGPTTPLRSEDGDLGRYETVEMVKIGDTPATLRSVRRSRRIISAKKDRQLGTVVLDLGATASALDMN